MGAVAVYYAPRAITRVRSDPMVGSSTSGGQYMAKDRDIALRDTLKATYDRYYDGESAWRWLGALDKVSNIVSLRIACININLAERPL
jgi:hypothetical protein